MGDLLDQTVEAVCQKFWKMAHKADFSGESLETVGSALGDMLHEVLEEVVPNEPKALAELITDIQTTEFDFYVGPLGGNDYSNGNHLLQNVAEDIVCQLAFARDVLMAALMPGYIKFEAKPVIKQPD